MLTHSVIHSRLLTLIGNMSSNIQVTKSCLFCRNAFTAHTLHTRYCSHSCNRKHYKQLKREEKLSQYSLNTASSSSAPQFGVSELQQKAFLSIHETALLLGASRRTIQRLIAKGSLKVGKVGTRSIIQRSGIDKLFK
jgi:excisionase family DNA binding protein